jgi:transcriptional regulator with XRE-family HTH domain
MTEMTIRAGSDLTSLGRAIAAARAAAGLSQIELAAKADVDRASLSQIETGKRDARLSTLLRIFEAAGARLSIEVTA